MRDCGYWVELQHAGQTLGAGFLVTRRHVLTAAHCIRGLGPEAELAVALSLGEPVPARVDQVASDADLALVRLLRTPPPAIRPPKTGRCRPRDEWFGPYRPGETDPHLSGSVVHEGVDYKCEGGAFVKALQLRTAVELGDYRGYSGGPVERRGECDTGAVIGMLLEQYPDRVTPERFSNTLFAAALGDALRQFDCFDVGHLLPVILPTDPPAAATPQPATAEELAVDSDRPTKPRSAIEQAEDRRLEQAVRRADILLTALCDWARRGLLEPGEVRMLRVQVARGMLDD